MDNITKNLGDMMIGNNKPNPNTNSKPNPNNKPNTNTNPNTNPEGQEDTKSVELKGKGAELMTNNSNC